MSIFVDHRGIERWTCFATGANGTAIDLVMVATGRSVGDAIAWLAERARVDRPLPERPAPVRRAPPSPAPAREPSAELREYVDACARILWQPAGAPTRRWLVEERCLDPEVLRHNRVGADPGPRSLRRAKGLPRFGPAAVFPALDGDRNPVYLQARYLHPPSNRGKYDNPTARLASNPRLTLVEPRSNGPDGLTLVTEGIPDALAAATGGYSAYALLGASAPDRRVAERLALRPGLVVIAFDADEAGRAGERRLVELMKQLDRAVLAIEPPMVDLNSWLVARGRDDFTRQLGLSISLTSRGSRLGAARSIA